MEQEYNKNLEERRPTWELLGIVIGYIGTVKAFWEICRFVLNLLGCEVINYSNRYKIGSAIVYALFISYLYLKLYRIITQKTKDKATKSDAQAVATAFKRQRIIRIIRTLGFSYLREKILSKFLGVALFDVFKRPSEWNNSQKNMYDAPIIRVWSKIKSKTYEIQFRNDMRSVSYRETIKIGGEFGTPEIIKWSSLPRHMKLAIILLKPFFVLKWLVLL
jgi:hypothetical protein